MISTIALILTMNQAMAVDIPTYRVVPPRKPVPGASTLSANLSGNVGSTVTNSIIEGLDNSYLGYDYNLFGKRQDLAVHEKKVDIRTLQAVQSGAAIQVGGSVSGRTQIEQGEDKQVVIDGKTITKKCFFKTAEISYQVEVASGGAIVENMNDTVTRKSGMSCNQDASKARSALPSDSAMYGGVANGVAINVLQAVKPVYRKVVYKVPADKSTKKLLKDIKKNKNVGPAIEEIGGIADMDAYNASAAIAMGVAYEMFGDAETAVSQFEKAVALDPKAEKHLERATSRKREVAALAAMGLDVNAGIPTAGAGRVVSVKGSSSKRTAITLEPGGGETVAMLPGKLKLKVVAASGKYVLVEAPDGKQGYILASMVK
jgi:hypothetical protein